MIIVNHGSMPLNIVMNSDDDVSQQDRWCDSCVATPVALFRPSVAALKATDLHVRENTVLVERGASHIVAAWCVKHAILYQMWVRLCSRSQSEESAFSASHQQTRRKVRFQTEFTLSEALSSGEGALVCLTKLRRPICDFLSIRKASVGEGMASSETHSSVVM